MAKRPTPIERAIAGEPTDRQQRYEKRLRQRGLFRLTVLVPYDRADEVRAVANRIRAEFEARDDD